MGLSLVVPGKPTEVNKPHCPQIYSLFKLNKICTDWNYKIYAKGKR